jgi:RNA recognition motif-containing protein
VLGQETKVSKKLYVANLSYSVKSPDLNRLFSRYGGVESATVIQHPETGRSQCFAFVEMATEHAARAARAGLDGYQHAGHAWSVRAVSP